MWENSNLQLFIPVVSYLTNSISKEILIHVLQIEHIADIYHAIEEILASQSRSKVTNLQIALAT
jgi:hypothetical protein